MISIVLEEFLVGAVPHEALVGVSGYDISYSLEMNSSVLEWTSGISYYLPYSNYLPYQRRKVEKETGGEKLL